MQNTTYRLYVDEKKEVKTKKSFAKVFYKSFLLKFLFVILSSVMFYSFSSFIAQDKKEKQLDNERKNLILQFELLNKRMNTAESILLKIQEQDDDTYRKILNVKTMPESMKKAGFGGVNPYAKYDGVLNSELLISTAKRIDVLSKKLAVQSKSFDEIIELAKKREKRLAVIPSVFPLNVSDVRKIGSPFGMRKHPILRTWKMHKGIDLVAKRGTKIMSSGAGVVIKAERSGGYGKCVKVDHGYGYVSIYAHMSKIKVKKGQKVKHGDLLGLVGSTGRSTGPHLHYELTIDGKAVDPENFFDIKLLKDVARK